MTRRILIAVDFSHPPGPIVDQAVELFRGPEVRFDLIHVILKRTVPRMSRTAAARRLLSAVTMSPDVVEAKLEEAMERVPEAVRGEAILEQGHPVARIVARASTGYACLAMGARLHTGIGSVLSGSMAVEVVQNSPIHVLLVRR